jgi:hypothetical protein
VSASTHVAFTVPDRTMVDRFHAAGRAVAAMAARDCGRTIIRTNMPPSSSIRTGTISKPCATFRDDPRHGVAVVKNV